MPKFAGPGQTHFETVDQAVPPRQFIRPQSRDSFGRIATPIYWGLNPEAYGEDMVSPRMRQLIRDVDLFRADILGIPSRVEALPTTRNVVGGVALDHAEFDTIHQARSAKYLANRIASRSSRQHALQGLYSPEHLEALVDQDVVGGLASNRDKMRRYADTTLSARAEVIEKVGEAANHPELPRWGNTGAREEIGTVKDIIFPHLLDVIGIQRRWNYTKSQAAGRALTWALFYDRDDNRHIDNWQNWLSLAGDHNNATRGLFSERADLLGNFLRANYPNHAERPA